MAWTPGTKHSSDFSSQSKNTGSWDTGIGYLLTELLGFILQENGGKIIIEPSPGAVKSVSWDYQTKH